MEAAGLLLGALPLALYAMDNYQRCLQVTTDYLRFQSTIKLLRSHIFLQQEQLHMTLRSIGLIKPTPVELEEHLRQRYPDKYDTFVDIIQHMERLLSKLMDKLDIDGEGKPRWTTEAPERASWEWRRVRRSFGRSSRQKLIEELQFWNDALKVCFERSELPLESDVSNPTLAAIKDTFNAQSCVSIRQQAHQVHEALLRSWRCQSHDHQGNLELTWHTDRASKPGDFKILLSYSASSTEAPAQVWQPLRLELQGLSMPPTTPSAIMQPPSLPLSPAINPGRDRRVRLREMFASRSRQAAQSPDLTQTLTRAQAISPAHMRAVADGPFEDMDAPSEVGESSFITQPRNLGDIVMTDIAAPSADPALLERPTDVDCLCSFLHRSTRLGRLRVEGREGLNQACILLRRQEDLHQHVKPIPLRAVLTPPAAPAGIAPVTKLAVSRKDRFAIAAAAAWAVLYLGDSPWISGDWTGKDILHLVTKSQFVLSSFYPSISFSLDRTTGASFSTTSLGAGELRSSLIRNRTIFALGILLVELCLDKSFEQLRHETFTSDIAASLGLGTTPDDYDIANLQVQKVYLEAGDDYGYAVQRCLRCEFPGRDVTKNFRFDHFRRDFFSYVVAPIQATFAMLPSSRFAL